MSHVFEFSKGYGIVVVRNLATIFTLTVLSWMIIVEVSQDPDYKLMALLIGMSFCMWFSGSLAPLSIAIFFKHIDLKWKLIAAVTAFLALFASSLYIFIEYFYGNVSESIRGYRFFP